MENEKFEPFDSLEDFVHDVAGDLIADGMVTKVGVIFEFIDEDGKLNYSILHDSQMSRAEAVGLVCGTFSQVIIEAKILLNQGLFLGNLDIDLNDEEDEDYFEEDEDDDESDR